MERRSARLWQLPPPGRHDLSGGGPDRRPGAQGSDGHWLCALPSRPAQGDQGAGAGQDQRGPLRRIPPRHRAESVLSALGRPIALGQRQAGHAHGREDARVRPLRAQQGSAGAGTARRQIPAAHRGGGAGGIEEARPIHWSEPMIKTALADDVLVSAAFAAKESTEGLDMQAARAKMMTARGKKMSYSNKFDLSALPHYQPQQKVSGTIRIRGSNYITDGPLGSYWEAAFRQYQPDARIDYQMKTTLAAVPSLTFGDGDVGIGRKVTFAEQEMFERYKDRSPVEVEVATGSYDVPGWQPGYGIVVR